MSIRLIVSDLDGTLLNGNREISARTLEVLKKCTGQGILLLPATGRALESVPKVLRGHPELFRYVMTANGARTFDLREEKTVDEALLSAQKMLSVMERITAFSCTWNLCLDGITWSEYHRADVPGFTVPQGRKNPEEGQMAFLRRHPETLLEKMDLYFDDPAERSRAADLFSGDPELFVSAAFSFNLELNHPDANKGSAIRRFAALFGIRREEILSFGDGTNDIPMFGVSGIGAAMENAPDEVRAAASYIAPSNLCDGVAEAIEALVF